jgi:hypothetical protein
MENSSDSIKNFVEEIGAGDKNVIDISKKMLAGGKEAVIVTLEKKKAMPERMESRARCHEFHDIDGFIQYITDNKTHNTLILSDVNGFCIKAILDDKASHGFEEIAYRPPRHPKFEMLEDGLLNQKMSIDVFARQVMRNRSVIVDSGKTTARDLAMAMQQITIASETTQSIGTGKVAVNGVMCKTEISAGHQEKVDLPDSFDVKVPIYLNTPEQQFGVDITISTVRGEVIANVDCPELEVKKFELFETLTSKIKKTAGIKASYGFPTWRDWRYNQ